MKIIKREKTPKGTLIYTVAYKQRSVTGKYVDAIGTVIGLTKEEIKENLKIFKREIDYLPIGTKRRNTITNKVSCGKGIMLWEKD